MRTQQEILARIAGEQDDFFGFTTSVLVCALDFEHAAPRLKDGITAEQWDQSGERTRTDEDVKKQLAEYMAFAWGKVEDHRGLSAGRSVDKLSAWVWLLGDDATLRAIDEAGYAQHGAPKLAVICKAYDLPIPDSGAIQRMIASFPCEPGCEQGCGQ